MQLSKELQLPIEKVEIQIVVASMKCSSRKNCNLFDSGEDDIDGPASMKCSSRKNCNLRARSAMGVASRPQ